MKKLIVILLMLFLAGCGVTSSETGSDGSDGSRGTDGRDAITPIVRPYTYDTTGDVCIFTDVSGKTYARSYSIGVSDSATGNNGICIYSGTNNAGKVLSVNMNGNIHTITIADNTDQIYSFIVRNDGPFTNSYTIILAADSDSKLNRNDNQSYIAWSIDSEQKEFYWSDTF